jgi:hypothetical protein
MALGSVSRRSVFDICRSVIHLGADESLSVHRLAARHLDAEKTAPQPFEKCAPVLLRDRRENNVDDVVDLAFLYLFRYAILDNGLVRLVFQPFVDCLTNGADMAALLR